MSCAGDKLLRAVDKDVAGGVAGINSNGSVNGTMAYDTTLLTADYTVLTSDRGVLLKVDASAANRTITLPSAASAKDGFTVGVKKTDSSGNTVTVDGNAAETIDGSLTKVISTQHHVQWYICDGTNWQVVAEGRAPSTGSSGSGSLFSATATKVASYTFVTGDNGMLCVTEPAGACIHDLPNAPADGYAVAVWWKGSSFSVKVQPPGGSADTVVGTNLVLSSAFYDLFPNECVLFVYSAVGTRWIVSRIMPPQQTGWVALTGTLDSGSTWDTGTMTLRQACQRLAALEAIVMAGKQPRP